MAKDTEGHPAQWALNLFKPSSPEYNKSILSYFPAFTGVIAGIHAGVYRNRTMRKPWYAHLHITIIASVFCGCFVQSLAYVFRVKRVRQDALLYDYISLHPDRFPEPENRKYADIIKPWYPLR